MLVTALSQAAKWDMSLIGIFGILFGALVTGIIVYAVVQAWGERRSNRQDELPGGP